MNVGDLVMWHEPSEYDYIDIGIILSFHCVDGNPFIWWAVDRQSAYATKSSLNKELTVLGGSDECR